MAKFLNSDGLTRLVALIKQALGGKQDELFAITNQEINDIIDTVVEIASIPFGAAGLVLSPDSGGDGIFNIDYQGSNAVTSYPETGTRACVMVPVSTKFAAIPVEKVWHNSSSGGSTEANFIDNTVLKEYTFIQFKDVDKVFYRLIKTDKVQAYSLGAGGYKELVNSKILDSNIIAWAWNVSTSPTILNIKDNGTNYTTSKEYCLLSNFKKSNDSSFGEVVYREDFDIILFPNTWDVTQKMGQVSYQDFFPNGGAQWGGGMDIYGDIMVQFYTTGKLLVMNKNTREVIAVGAMDVGASNMHCNAVSFGTTIPSGSTVPYLYVSQWTSGYCDCHVMKLTWENNVATCTRVQKISYSGSKFNSSLNWDWSVDAKTGYLWCYGYASSASDRFGAKVALKYNIPSLSSTTVSLSDSDKIAERTFTFNGLFQDTHIENDLMFYEFGYNNSSYLGGVLLIDLSTSTPTLYSNNIISMVDTGLELEGITRDGTKLIITTHEPNVNTFDLGVYEVDLLQNNI